MLTKFKGFKGIAHDESNTLKVNITTKIGGCYDIDPVEGRVIRVSLL